MPNSYDITLNVSKRQGIGRGRVPGSSVGAVYIVTKVFNSQKKKKVGYFKSIFQFPSIFLFFPSIPLYFSSIFFFPNTKYSLGKIVV